MKIGIILLAILAFEYEYDLRLCVFRNLKMIHLRNISLNNTILPKAKEDLSAQLDPTFLKKNDWNVRKLIIDEEQQIWYSDATLTLIKVVVCIAEKQ